MTITLNGTTGITTPDVDSSADISANGVTVGRGAGAVSNNTAVGASALAANTSGGNNTAVGSLAGYANTTGAEITAIGSAALYDNTTGSSNVAVGRQSLRFNTTASYNTAVGYQAGYSQTTADYNTFIGYYAGRSTTGNQNTFIGKFAGNAVTTGTLNTIIGAYNGNQGGLDIRTASNYIVLSDGGGTPRAWFRGSDGLLFCPPMYAVTSGNSANVVVNPDGGVLRSTSALKYKQDIRDLPSIDINKFRPVIYKSKCEGDDQTKDHFGFIADEVDEVGIKELVQYGAEGEIEGFSYDRMTAVLVKAIQELSAQVTALQAEVNQLKGN